MEKEEGLKADNITKTQNTIMIKFLLITLSSFLATTSCNSTKTAKAEASIINVEIANSIPENASKAYFASGCFWCVEAIYESVNGVHEVISGYAEGTKENARYDRVSAGTTNHVEAVEVYYDPDVVSYQTLVDVFFGSGDPTTLNRQGPDRGYQYRSAIYYQNDEEKEIAEAVKEQLTLSNAFADPIVTDITALTTFFPAEEYHQDYERRNPNQGYVRAVSIPRLNRFKSKFPSLLKKEH